jgi:hypothetical protein
MLFKEIIAVYSENHTKPTNTKCSSTDCQNRWFIQLPLGLKGLNLRFAGSTSVIENKCKCVLNKKWYLGTSTGHEKFRNNKTEQSLECTDILNVSFTPYHIVRYRIHMIRTHCCTLGKCCTNVSCSVPLLRKKQQTERHERAHKVFLARDRTWGTRNERKENKTRGVKLKKNNFNSRSFKDWMRAGVEN